MTVDARRASPPRSTRPIVDAAPYACSRTNWRLLEATQSPSASIPYLKDGIHFRYEEYVNATDEDNNNDNDDAN